MNQHWPVRRLFSALLVATLAVALAPALPATTRSSIPIQAREVTTSVGRERIVELPFAASHVALHWPGAADAGITVAFSADGTTYGPAERVEHDEAGRHGGEGDETYGSVIWTDGARFVRVTSDRPLARLTVVTIDSATRTAASGGHVVAAVDQPAIISRAGWSADETLRFDAAGNELWPPEFHPTKKLVVHHTAGKNDDPDPAATVRAIYYYHAVTRGWGDIGYNFLIDESGRIYEGRYSREYAASETPTGEDTSGRGVTAAHVGGWNSGTMGVALLGTLSETDAKPPARSSLEWMLAWKAERNGLDPHGNDLYTNPVSGATTTAANISGHRDWAATECPGGLFYATLPALRDAVAARMTTTAPATVPGAPLLTAATASGAPGVQLSWTEPSDGGSAISSYRILRKKRKAWEHIATVSGSTTSYHDAATRRRRTYTYVVRAVNAVGVGPASNEASATAR